MRGNPVGYGVIMDALAGVTVLGGMAWGVLTRLETRRDQEKRRDIGICAL